MKGTPGAFANRPQLEVIATSVDDGVAAARGGADRLEVVSAMEVDGLLPDLDVVCRLRDAVAVPLRVMLRSAPGFTVNSEELDALSREAERLRSVGVDQVVFGFLTEDGNLDQEAMRELWSAAKPNAWTLHRAFDHVIEAEQAFAQCTALPGLDLILSAGGPGGLDLSFSTLCSRAAWQTAQLRWMAGGGLRLDHIAPLRAAGITQFHSGRVVRQGQRWDAPVKEAMVRQLKDAMLVLPAPQRTPPDQ